MYKVQHEQSPVYLAEMFSKTSKIHLYNTHNRDSLLLPNTDPTSQAQ